MWIWMVQIQLRTTQGNMAAQVQR